MPTDLATAIQPRAIPGPLSEQVLRRAALRESNARSYSRRFPLAVKEARGEFVTDLDGRVYLDFLAGAGSLPLGHSHPDLIRVAREQVGVYLHGLDFATEVRTDFMEAHLARLPEAMASTYRMHFCGPTGANAIDAAIKLAKTATGRSDVLSFRGGFHGTTHLTMAVTGLVELRERVSNTAPGVQFAPFSYCSRCPIGLNRSTCEVNCATSTESLLRDVNGGMLPPAAIILEMVQGEGGNVPAEPEFVQRIARLAKEVGAVLIVDEIQTGCGRTGTWFSFEQYGIEPDIVCVSKAMSGIGTPLAVIMYRDSLDVWGPGAHTGTFRGNQMAFATSLEFLRIVERDSLLENVQARSAELIGELSPVLGIPEVREIRGLGLMVGIELQDPETQAADGQLARLVQRRALERGLIVELGGRDDCVVRLLPPLNIGSETVKAAAGILVDVISQVTDTGARLVSEGAHS